MLAAEGRPPVAITIFFAVTTYFAPLASVSSI